jgi:adenylate cyclase
MKKARSKYQVHAELARTGSTSADFDDAKAGHPLERRLNRLERVAATYRGRVDLRFNNGMLMTFETADAALLGACEMQHRCAVLPQVSKQRLALRIGAHQYLIRQRLKDHADNSPEIVSQLAMADDSIVVSENLFSELNPDLRKLTRLLNETPAGLAVYKVDWRTEIPSGAFGGESFWPASMNPPPAVPYLLLHHGLKTLETTQNNPVVTVGRDPSSDLVLVDSFVSRHHCRIERKSDCILLTDSSTNGTCIATDEGVEVLVKNRSAILKGKGLMFFGRPFKGERRGAVRYEAY